MEPIRVLHIVTYMGRGGLETMIMNYYRNIDRTKIQFDFLVHRDFIADYDEEIESLGGKIYRIQPLNPFSSSYKKTLDSFFKNHPEYKIIHVHQDCLSSVALKIAKDNNVPVRIAHSHSSSQDKNIKYLIKLFYMRSIPKYATNLFACGKEAGDWMFSGSSYIIMNNAIDTEKFEYNQNKGIQIKSKFDFDDKLVIGHVGRFMEPKNHEFLIDIFAELNKLNSNSRLILIGSGNLQIKIQEKVNDLGLQDLVLFLGNRSDVNELMQGMDVFLFPSLYEGLPVTLVEAQASGLDIYVSSNVPKQCKMTDNISFLDLDKGAKYWAKYILEHHKSFVRTNTKEEIVKDNFDIKANAKWLENFYLKEVSKYE